MDFSAWFADAQRSCADSNAPSPPWVRDPVAARALYDQMAAGDAKRAERSELDQLRAEITRLSAENAALRGNQSAQAKRVAWLEMMIGHRKEAKPGGAMWDAVGMALAEIRKDIDKRLAALEQRPTGLSWEGTWTPEKAYPGSGVVIHDGGAWIALQPTCPGEKPGTGGQWRLFVRSNESELRKLIRDELRKPRTP
jgi:hypothetical protein